MLTSGLLFDTPAHAQYTADFQTNIISGVTSNWTGDYIVGFTNDAEALVIESVGVLSNANGFVGGLVTNDSGVVLGTSNNVAVVNGAGSVWNNGGNLCIGCGLEAGNNQLVVTNGGAVYSVGGDIGENFSDNDTVLVSGTGSVWSNSGALLLGGYSSDGDSLTIADGGAVYNNDVTLGDGQDTYDDTVLVTGSGSQWSTGNLFLGQYSCNLTITNGGAVYNTSTEIIGEGPNSVLVTGSGSVWNSAVWRFMAISAH
jgi:fibronectin-binding autotransporter adhesin